LWDIAQKYNDVSSTEIMRLNNLSTGRNLYVGQQLKIKKRL
jgi:LysM repeat protein